MLSESERSRLLAMQRRLKPQIPQTLMSCHSELRPLGNPDPSDRNSARFHNIGRKAPMRPIMRDSLAYYGAVAVLAVAISAAATWGGSTLFTSSLAQPAAGGVRQILAQPLADLPGREVRMSLLDREPGSS